MAVGDQTCQTASSALFNAHTRRTQVSLRAALNGTSGRDLVVAGNSMEPLEPSAFPPSLCICLPQAGNSCCRTVTGSLCWLLRCIDLGDGHHYSHSRHCPINLAPEPIIHSLFSSPSSCPTALHTNLVDMVRHCMRSRSGGTRGGSSRPPAVPSPVSATSLHSHEFSPPPRSPPRNYPHTRSGQGLEHASMDAHSDIRLHTTIFPLLSGSVRHSTQFRFQSSLNRPIITTNVTIVFSKDNEQNSAQARNSVAPSQEERNQGEDRGRRGVSHGSLHGEGVQAGDIPLGGGKAAEASIRMEFAGNSSGTQHASKPPGGVEKGDVEEKEEDWDQYACPIVEEPPDQVDNN